MDKYKALSEEYELQQEYGDSEKAFIEEVALQQDENFLYMGIAKRQKNEQIHFKQKNPQVAHLTTWG